MTETAASPRPAASALFIRDAPLGHLEIFMVVRNTGLSFGSGMMVFPGGKVVAEDHVAAMHPALPAHHPHDAHDSAHAVAALREAYEEAGLLLAKTTTGDWVKSTHVAQLGALRRQLDQQQLAFGTLLAQEKLVAAIDEAIFFAHIIGPKIAPRRFDTRFYLVPAPPGQVASVDGREMIESLWLDPHEALSLGQKGERGVMAPTRMVLERLATFPNVAAAISGARAVLPGTILPRLEQRDGVTGLATDDVPGFPASWEVLTSASATSRGLVEQS